MNWRRWGAYVSERAWGTVREDYSPDGSAWAYFPFDHARLRAYRWGEDGIAGLCDRHQLVCFAVAVWNGHDPILKERLFGLGGPEGNHGEDVKEVYAHLDATPTHSWLRFLYRYPQAEFPYARLREENARRTKADPEYELWDTGVLDGGRYFDVEVAYAKASFDDVLIRVTATNRGPEPARLVLLPTVWFRNTWSWGLDARRPRLRAADAPRGASAVAVMHRYYGERLLVCDGAPELLFTENVTNREALWNVPSEAPFTKDGIERFVVKGESAAVNPARTGSKASALYDLTLAPGESRALRLRFLPSNAVPVDPLGPGFEETFRAREAEADAFYDGVLPVDASADARRVMRQALAGLVFSEQFYYYDVVRWLKGDPDQPEPPKERLHGRNADWKHLYNADVLLMPDKWEYPWYAAWDLAFHCVALAIVDPALAKQQLVLMLREWYMHPNGQLPAYEWKLDDVNPPVHAWAAWRVYKIDARRSGKPDRRFLARVFHKLLLNFTWWVNRKDAEGRNVFEGGFLGLDNIGVFDRSAPLPTGGHIEQADGTSWMGMYCLSMLAMALELSRGDSAYEDVASKFFEHFVAIARALNDVGGVELWDEKDGFYYDVLHLPGGERFPLKVRSMVGLIPLFAVETLEPDVVDRLPGFKRRMQWFLENRKDFSTHVASETTEGGGVRRLLSLVNQRRLARVLDRLLDPEEFLSPFGVRALSRWHRAHPYELTVDGYVHRVDYEPGESKSGLFGGNSNWRGPVWFPVNFLLIEALQRYHHFLGDDFRAEYPKGSGHRAHLKEVAADLSRRLVSLFLLDANGRRPCHGGRPLFRDDPAFRDLPLFHEFFHGEDGSGLGASHQTGWTALVAKLIQQIGPAGGGAAPPLSGPPR